MEFKTIIAQLESGECMISNQVSTPQVEHTTKNLVIFTVAAGLLLLTASVIFTPMILAIAAVSYVSAYIVEAGFAKFRKRPLDKAWFVTPMIFTLMLPPTAPLWMAAIGSSFGVFFGKAVFGGSGRNVFNPAVVGTLFLSFAFPPNMLTTWLNPVTNDVVSSATPLITLNRGIPFPYSFTELLLGNTAGSIGETFRLGILVLGIVLIVLKIADWRIPTFYLGTVFGLNLIGGLLLPGSFRDPVLSLLVGGLLFAAFFVATDPVSAPLKPSAKMIYGIGLGIITVVIRNFATFPEGIIFAVIIMNALSPMIDNMLSKQKEEEATQ